MKQMRCFKEEIVLERAAEPKKFMKQLMREYPELLYYIARFSVSMKNGQQKLTVKYRNKEFPFREIIVDDLPDTDRLLNDAVKLYRNKEVIAVPARFDLEWAIDLFIDRTVYNYPYVRSVGYSVIGNGEFPYTIYEIRFSYYEYGSRLRDMENVISAEIERIAKQLFPIEMPESAKCYIAHNYLVATVAYRDNSSVPERFIDDHSAYGLLMHRECVCHGFADAYSRILRCAGISCDIVPGESTGENAGHHAWNIVNFSNGKSVHVDTTWDASQGRKSRKYCFVSDVFMMKDHYWEKNHFAPCCNGDQLLEEARSFCKAHRAELLESGLEPEWLD